MEYHHILSGTPQHTIKKNPEIQGDLFPNNQGKHLYKNPTKKTWKTRKPMPKFSGEIHVQQSYKTPWNTGRPLPKFSRKTLVQKFTRIQEKDLQESKKPKKREIEQNFKDTVNYISVT